MRFVRLDDERVDLKRLKRLKLKVIYQVHKVRGIFSENLKLRMVFGRKFEIFNIFCHSLSNFAVKHIYSSVKL